MKLSKLYNLNFHIWEAVYVISAFGFGASLILRDYIMVITMIIFHVVSALISKHYFKKLYVKKDYYEYD